MTSAFTLAQPRSPATVFSHPSNSSTSRSNASDRMPVRWRSSLIARRRKQIRENSPSQRLHSTGAYDSFPKSDEKRLPEAGKSQMLRKLYVDQQTGEMRLSTTDQAVGHEIIEDGETNHIRRYLPHQRIRSQTAIESTSPRCFWDQSLRTRSIPINSRGSHSASDGLPFLMRTSTPQQHSVRNHLPRISRSAENVTSSSAYEINTRYPRGQQRPTGLASGHHALLLRHKEIVEASRKSHDAWRRRQRGNHLDRDDPRLKRVDPCTKYLNKAYPSLFRGNPPTLIDDRRPQKCCGQEVESVMKSNRKCLEWFDTWVND